MSFADRLETGTKLPFVAGEYRISDARIGAMRSNLIGAPIQLEGVGMSGTGTQLISGLNRLGANQLASLTTAAGEPNPIVAFLEEGSMIIDKRLIIDGSLIVQGSIDISGSTTYSGNVQVNGDLDVSGNITGPTITAITDRLDIIDISIGVIDTRLGLIDSSLAAVDISLVDLNNIKYDKTGGLIDGNVDISGLLFVSGDASFNTNVEVVGNLTVRGTVIKKDELDVSGNIDCSSNITADGNITTTGGDLFIGALSVSTALSTLDISVNALEGSVSIIDASINILDGRVSVLDASVNVLDGRVSVLDASVNALEGSVSILDASVNALEGSVSVLDVSVNALDGRVSTLEGEVLDLSNNKYDKTGGLISGNVVITDDTSGNALFVNNTRLFNAVGEVSNSFPVAQLAVKQDPNSFRGLEIGGPAGGVTGPVYLKVKNTSNRMGFFNQSNLENMTILSGGNVGIGTTIPTATLDVSGAMVANGNISTSGGDLFIGALSVSTALSTLDVSVNALGNISALEASFNILDNSFTDIVVFDPSSNQQIIKNVAYITPQTAYPSPESDASGNYWSGSPPYFSVISIVSTQAERDLLFPDPYNGQAAYDLCLNNLAIYNGNIWRFVSFQQEVTLTVTGFTLGSTFDISFLDSGGSIVAQAEPGGSTIARFFPTSTTSGTVAFSSNLPNVNFLVVAGGGGGSDTVAGGAGSGGGGAGGLKTNFPSGITKSVLAATALTVVVGGGGAGAPNTNVGTAGSNGSISQFDDISCNGGGGGGFNSSVPAIAGGSGGGGGLRNSAAGGAATPADGQGNAGGIALVNDVSATGRAGGGGGSGSVGATGTASGNGGSGTASTITGVSLTFAAGGGGGGFDRVGGVGTAGVSGNGGFANSGSQAEQGGDGTNGRGGGGGGSAGLGVALRGGNGGSGVVVLRFPSFV